VLIQLIILMMYHNPAVQVVSTAPTLLDFESTTTAYNFVDFDGER
jgi:hypothetical protein